MAKLKKWKDGFEKKGLIVNVGKTKVMRCSTETNVVWEAGKFLCSICRKGVGRNSILCSDCGKWVHKKCSGMKGRLEPDASYQCMRCKTPRAVTPAAA
jgi:DNA-directed RNA polymerase subunit RPC12/RpoP